MLPGSNAQCQPSCAMLTWFAPLQKPSFPFFHVFDLNLLTWPTLTASSACLLLLYAPLQPSQPCIQQDHQCHCARLPCVKQTTFCLPAQLQGAKLLAHHAVRNTMH